MKSVFIRLKRRFSASGESIVETLAAVLICSLAVLMLYTALASAARMNASANSQSTALREDALVAELQIPNPDNMVYQEVTVDGFEYSYNVEYYTGEGQNYTSYRML